MCILEISDIYIYIIPVDIIGNIRFNVFFAYVHNFVFPSMFKQVGGTSSQEMF